MNGQTSKFLTTLMGEFGAHFKSSPVSSFHSFLWDILVKEQHKGKLVTLYAEFTDNMFDEATLQLLVVEANVAGYYKTRVEFVTDDLHQAQEIAMALTKRIWKLSPTIQLKIVNSSMVAQEMEVAL